MVKAFSDKVGIVGMGIISSIGDDVLGFDQALKRGVSGVSTLKRRNGPELSVNIGAEIPDYSFIDRLYKCPDLPVEILRQAKKSAQRSTFPVQTSVLSALEAWRDSRLSTWDGDPERIGIVVAGESTTQNYRYGLHDSFKDNPEYLSPRYALQFLDTNQVGVLSEIFNIKGEGFVIGGASASGNVGIIKAAQMIQLGIVDTCLVVGVVADLSPVELQGFINIGAMGGKNKRLAPENASRPFDIQHDGFIYGQASACVVLESLEHAKARGVPIRSELLGGVIKLDGVSTSEPSVVGETNVMNSALLQSGVSASKIDYLNAHGSASPLGDSTEIEAIKRVFNDHVSRLWVNSTKGLTGHCLYSAGIVELIATVLQMEGDYIHPSKNLDEPIDNDIRFSGATAEKDKIAYAMSNSFGFGGINTSIVLKNSSP